MRCERLLAGGVYWGRHTSDDLPRAVSPDPGMCDPHCIRSRHFAGVILGPVQFYSIMIDRDVAGHLNRQLLDGVRLQGQAF